MRKVPPGASLVIHGTILVQLLDVTDGTASDPVTFGATFFTGGKDHTVRNVGKELLTIRVIPGTGSLCKPAG